MNNPAHVQTHCKSTTYTLTHLAAFVTGHTGLQEAAKVAINASVRRHLSHVLNAI